MGSGVNLQAAQSHFYTANQLKESGQLDAAVASYQQTLAIEPDCADAMSQLAEVYYIQGKLSEARAQCHRALKINPHFALPYKTLGNILHFQGKIEAAIRSYLKAIELKPDFAEAYANLGSMYYQMGRLDSANSCYQKAIKITPDVAGFQWNLSKIFEELGWHEEAIKSQQKALELNPNLGTGEVHFNLASRLLAANKLEESIRSYNTGLQLDPYSAEAYVNLGIACRKLGRLEEAVSNYQKAIAIEPHFAEAHFSLGNAFFDLRQLSEAISSYQKTIQINGDLVEAHFRLGNALFEQGQLEEAARSYQQVLQQEPNHLRAYLNLGFVWCQLGELSETVNAYRHAIAIQPNLAEAHCNLGNALFAIGKPQEAVSSYQQAIDLKPNLAEAHFGLGNTFTSLRQLAEAIASYNRAIHIRANYSEAYINLADALAREGYLEEAIACSQKLLQIKPEQRQVYFQTSPVKGAIAPFSGEPKINIAKKVCRSTRELAAAYKADKNKNNLSYIEIHPRSQISLSLPRTLDGNVHKHLSDIQGRSPEAFVAVVPDGRVCGDLYNTLVITSDNQLLADVSTNTGQTALIFCFDDLPPIHLIQGTVAILSTLAGADYYHWMIDVLPRIELIRQSGVALESIDKFVLNDYRYSFQTDTLKALGIPETKIISITEYCHLKASRLLVPSVPSSLPKWFGDFIDVAPKWVCNFLRKEFLPPKDIEQSNTPERIYISRKQASRRRVINEDEVISLLNQFGFRSIPLESMSVSEQAAALTGAKVVIAPHGAGLTNLVFCRPGTKVIEIFSPLYVTKYYWGMSNQIGLEYYYIIGENIERDKISPYRLSKSIKYQVHPLCEDIFINLDSLIKILECAGLTPK